MEEAKKPEEPPLPPEKKDDKAAPPATEKKDEPPPPPPQEIVLKVFMHCEGCARKVRRCLKGFPGNSLLSLSLTRQGSCCLVG